MNTLKLALVVGVLVLFALPVLGGAMAGTAPVVSPAVPSPRTMDLSGPWKFSTDREESGQALGWQKADFDASKWRVLHAPQAWEEQGITNPNLNWPENEEGGGYNGYAWYRKTVTIPADWTTGTVTLRIGSIHDSDWTYVNGVQVGMTTGKDAYEQLREYTVPQTVLRLGQPNVIAIRVLDVAGAGGIYDGPVELVRETPEAAAKGGAEEDGGRAYANQTNSQTKVGGSIEVPTDTEVSGDAVAIGGSVTVNGHVTGEAVAVGGSVNVNPGGCVDGNATSIGGRVNRAEGATIGGQVVEMPFLRGAWVGHFAREPFWWRTDGVRDLLFWIFLALLTALLIPRRMELMARALPTAPGAAALYGVFGFIALPAVILAILLACLFVILVLLVTIVGWLAIPAVALAMAAALLGVFVIFLVGSAAVWLSLGRAILDALGRKETRTLWAMLLGMLAVWILTQMPVIAVPVSIAVVIFGFGVAIMTGLGTHENWSSRRMDRGRGQETPPPATPVMTAPAPPPVVVEETAPAETEERPEPPPV